MSAMLYPFSVPHTQNTWDCCSPAPARTINFHPTLADIGHKIIVHIASTIELTDPGGSYFPCISRLPLLFWMFPETSCQCPRPQVITQWWPASVSLSQISIVHSSLLSSVASRSLSFVKHSANIHNLLPFLFYFSLIEPPHSAWCIASISLLTNIFGSFYQKSIFLSFLPLLWSVGTQDRPVWPYLWYLRPHLSQMHISCIVTKYLQMCVFCPLDTLAGGPSHIWENSK